MKTWNTPELVTLEINNTEWSQNGNNHGKMCIYNASIPCNKNGNGKGMCKNCPNNTDFVDDIAGNVNALS